jgi:hypothetical protein
VDVCPLDPWALGYTDFPARQEGDATYYWRKELRKRANLSDEAARAVQQPPAQ